MSHAASGARKPKAPCQLILERRPSAQERIADIEVRDPGLGEPLQKSINVDVSGACGQFDAGTTGAYLSEERVVIFFVANSLGRRAEIHVSDGTVCFEPVGSVLRRVEGDVASPGIHSP